MTIDPTPGAPPVYCGFFALVHHHLCCGVPCSIYIKIPKLLLLSSTHSLAKGLRV